MITKETLEAVSQGPAIKEATAAIDFGRDGSELVALPNNFNLHDMERFANQRRRARGTMTTPSMGHFAAYVSEHKEEGAAVFIDPDAMQARAVLNLGSPERPGHADNPAVLAPKKTAAYTALLSLLQIGHMNNLSQRILAEFLEDWAPNVQCFDQDGGVIELKRVIDAVRRITIESARSVESEERSLSAQRSVMESVGVHSKAAPLPTIIAFACEPYTGLPARKFTMRLAVRTGDLNKPSLTLALHMIREDQHAEEMAQELCREVEAAIDSEVDDDAIAVLIGAYKV